MTDGKLQRDAAAEAVAENDDLRETEVIDQCQHVVGEEFIAQRLGQLRWGSLTLRKFQIGHTVAVGRGVGSVPFRRRKRKAGCLSQPGSPTQPVTTAVTGKAHPCPPRAGRGRIANDSEHGQ